MRWDELSVIIPLAKGEKAWVKLLPDLRLLPRNVEILFISPERDRALPPSIAQSLGASRAVKWLHSESGRARQLNEGARQATGLYLWFLHADSRFDDKTLLALENSLQRLPVALHYFNLAFEKGGPWLLVLNQWGAWVRSHWLGLPFGDQGFCLPRQTFFELGGYDETALYGEDHLLVWKARRAGVPLKGAEGYLQTSARKYREQGWLPTTLRYGVLTARQALPQAWGHYIEQWIRKGAQ